MKVSMKDYPLALRLTILFASLTLFFFGMIQARDFLYPIAIAMLFSYLLLPVTSFLEKHRFPRIIAILISIILAIAVLLAGSFFIYTQITGFTEGFPEMKKQAQENISLYKTFIEEYFGISKEIMDEIFQVNVSGFFDSGSEFRKAFTATTGTIIKIGLMPVYIFLFLFYRTKFAYFILKIVPQQRKMRTIKILRDISKVGTKYMGGMFIVVCVLCVLNSAGLAIVGLKYAIMLGVISALFNFIPYFGTLLGASVPLLFAIFTGDSSDVFGVIILYVIIQFTENNLLTPNIVGENLKLNPFVIILGLVLGATLWGLPGMIVIVPLLAMLKIVCRNIDELRPYAFLLGTRGAKSHALTIDNIKAFFISRFFKKKLSK